MFLTVMIAMKFIFTALFVSQIDALMESASKAGTLGMQGFVIFLLFVLATIVMYQNRESKRSEAARIEKEDKRERERAEKEEQRFKEILDHHEKLVAKVDQERHEMTSERLTRNDALMQLVRECTAAMTLNAHASAKQTDVTESLAELIRDRIKTT
jgi:flagellar biosynthesis/type III secretory pathway M-ring protein FliF/YscJ